MKNVFLQMLYWKTRCQLAEKYIEKSLCDPDETPEQFKAWNEWLQLKEDPELIEFSKEETVKEI